MILLENDYILRVILTETHFMDPMLSTRLGELEIEPPTVGPYNAGAPVMFVQNPHEYYS